MKFGINRVKIRILSGGKEHSTLESLRESFSLEDVLPSYNDGRLATWLRQRDEDDIADKLVKLKQEEKQPEALALALINIFFNGEKGEEFNSVLDFANYCMQNGQKLTADHAYDYVIQQNDENKQIELAKNGALTLEKALKNGISGKTMYIICRNLLNAAEKDDAKKNIAYQWFYEAEKCNDEETVEFKKTGDYQIICNEVPLQTKTITFNDQEYVDLGLSVYWAKRKYDILQSQTETMPPIKWEGGCWAYPNKYQLEELSQQGSFHYFSKTENCRGVLIKDCLFLPFLDNSHNYGFIIGEGDYCLYYDNSGTMKIVEKSKYAPAFIFPVLTKLS